ncbi:MAG: hypothetical protein EXS15_02310 [Phycisphaerales bacterium]|nr:hypothetical protein [Phycisphaerales bacterium]
MTRLNWSLPRGWLPRWCLSRRWWVAVPVCVLGCSPTTINIAKPDGAAPSAEEFSRAQSQRIHAIPSLALRGHAELHWSDTKGRHFDDGDFDLILRPPSELSLRLSKVGEKFLWVGGGGGQSWMVFPRESPPRAVLREWDAHSPAAPQDSTDLRGVEHLMDPVRVMEALGVAAVSPSEVTAIDWDGKRGAWVFTLPNRRMFARGESLLPVGCDWLNATDQVVASCALDGFEWIRGDRPSGAPPASTQPLVATRIHFSIWSKGRTATDGSPDGELLLAASEPAFGAERIRPQLFNWDDVRDALRPEVVERLTR